MSVAKTIEITADSPQSFEHAIQAGIDKANDTLNNVRSAWVKDQIVQLDGGRVTGYRVRLRVTFELS